MQAGTLTTSIPTPPAPPLRAHRIITRQPVGTSKACSFYGPWTPERSFLIQYHWADHTPLLNSSTAQLHALQARHRQTPHTAHLKWEMSLAQPLPENIWSSIWIQYRGASENAFLWQLLYRVIATQHWRFPTCPATDPSTWCTRCTAGIREDLTHCIWSCSISEHCWLWGTHLLHLSLGNSAATIQIGPAHIFIAAPLPVEWLVPEKLWHLLKAILCWQIWKNRNAHYMAGKQADAQKIVRKSWHRLGMYMQKEWRFLLKQINLGKLTLDEAKQMMTSQFSSCPDIWNLHGLILQVPLVPPRPP